MIERHDTTSDLKAIFRGLVFFFAISLMLVAFIGVYVLDTRITLPVENVTELVQETLLLITAGILYFAAIRMYELRAGLLLVAGFVTALFIRELDAFFDVWSRSAWVYVEAAVLIPLIAYCALCGWQSILRGLSDFIRSNAFIMMATGVALLLIYSRLYGSGHFWGLILGVDSSLRYAVKRVSEESLELISYFVMFMAAISYLWERRHLVR